MTAEATETPDVQDNTDATEAPENTDATVLNASEESAETAPPVSAPESYEDFKVAEGLEVVSNIADEFKSTAKEMNLSQENAQKLVDLQTKVAQNQAEKMARQWGEQREGWVEGLKVDKEFGGEKFDETAERANRALKRFGSEDLTKYLTGTGMGDYPELIKLLARVDKAVGEDSVDSEGGEAGLPDDPASILYPGSPK